MIFDSTRFGLAKHQLEEEGIYASGNHKYETNIQSHHIVDRKNNEKLINDPENIEFMTSRAHLLCHSIPEETATSEEKQKFMQKFGEVMDQECPHSIVIAICEGDSCKLVQNQAIGFTKELYDFVREYMKNFQKSLEVLLQEN